MRKIRIAHKPGAGFGLRSLRHSLFAGYCFCAGFALLLVGCGGSRENFVFTGPSSSAWVAPAGAGATHALTGTISYERLLPVSAVEPDDGDVGPARLDFAHPEPMPCRYVRVQLLDAQGQLLSETYTDSQGGYRFESLAPGQTVKIRALAESVKLDTASAAIRVQDNTNNSALYAAESSVVSLDEIGVVNLDFPTGYDAFGEQAQGTVRSSAPFSCLDGILTGYRYFLAGGLRAETIPVCVVNWSERNRPEHAEENEPPAAALADGRIGTSNFSSEINQLSILGFRQADTDEFDWHIMIHEFGHWMQSNAFRDNTTGGLHGAGEIKDPRLAFSEGFGNALGGLALGDPVYKDTTAMGGFSLSLECNLSPIYDPNLGWFSESTVQTILFDLFDPKREEGGVSRFSDQIELPLPLFIGALTEQTRSSTLTTVFSFLSGLVKTGLSADQMSQVLALLAFESRSADFGLNSLDESSLGETHGAAVDSLPVYRDAQPLIAAGVSPLTLPGQPQEGVYNSLRGARYFRFNGDGSSVTITARNSTSTVGAIYVQLFEDGKLVSEDLDEEAENADGDEDDDEDVAVTRLTQVGSTYVVVFTNTSTEASTTDIEFASTGGTTP